MTIVGCGIVLVLAVGAAWALGYLQGWERGFVFGEGEERRRADRRAKLTQRAPSEGSVVTDHRHGFDTRRLHPRRRSS